MLHIHGPWAVLSLEQGLTFLFVLLYVANKWWWWWWWWWWRSIDCSSWPDLPAFDESALQAALNCSELHSVPLQNHQTAGRRPCSRHCTEESTPWGRFRGSAQPRYTTAIWQTHCWQPINRKKSKVLPQPATVHKKVKGTGVHSSLWKPITELRSVTCHMRSHSIICYPTQVNAPRLNPSHAGRYLVYLPRRDGRVRWPWWLVIYLSSLHVCRHPPIQVVTIAIATRPGKKI